MHVQWNEPGLHRQPSDLVGGGDWWGSVAEYYELYAQAARALKKVSPKLQVGGPAIAGCGGGCTSVQAFVDWCGNNSVPLDFISTHTCERANPAAADDACVL